MLNDNTGNHLTLNKQMSSRSYNDNVTSKLFAYKSYIQYMYKQDLTLNNPQTQPNNHSSHFLCISLIGKSLSVL